MLQEQNVTTIYRQFATADLVRSALIEQGIATARIHVIPDRATDIDTESADGLFDVAIQDLDLPEADTHLYQDAARRGDVIVSARVPVSDVPRVEEIMRQPEVFAEGASAEEVEAELRGERASEAAEHVEPRSADITTMPIGR